MTTDAAILLTGATGFVGGSPCLLRGADRAAILTSTYGERVKPVLYSGLDDLETTTAAAAQHDLIVNTTLGYHSASAQALLRGLARRKEQTGRDAWFIHTSGTSNLSDKPVTNPGAAVREFDDLADDVYAHEKALDAVEAFGQRTTELGVIDAGLELGVKTLVIMSPIIYGIGTGLFNRVSAHTQYMKAILKIGHAVVVGAGSGVYDHVHINDVAVLYRLVVQEILERGGEALPIGKKGILFSANGRHSWQEYSQLVADAGYERGLLSETKVTVLDTLEEVVATLIPHLEITSKVFDTEQLISAAEHFCSSAMTVANVARRIGWKPVKGAKAWEQSFRDDLDAIRP